MEAALGQLATLTLVVAGVLMTAVTAWGWRRAPKEWPPPEYEAIVRWRSVTTGRHRSRVEQTTIDGSAPYAHLGFGHMPRKGYIVMIAGAAMIAIGSGLVLPLAFGARGLADALLRLVLAVVALVCVYMQYTEVGTFKDPVAALGLGEQGERARVLMTKYNNYEDIAEELGLSVDETRRIIRQVINRVGAQDAPRQIR